MAPGCCSPAAAEVGSDIGIGAAEALVPCGFGTLEDTGGGAERRPMAGIGTAAAAAVSPASLALLGGGISAAEAPLPMSGIGTDSGRAR